MALNNGSSYIQPQNTIFHAIAFVNKNTSVRPLLVRDTRVEFYFPLFYVISNSDRLLRQVYSHVLVLPVTI
jgi:hypothetical protein